MLSQNDTKMGDVTRRAYEALTDEEFFKNIYKEELAVYDTLEFLEEDNFKTLSQVLRDMMIEKGLCSSDASDIDLINALANPLIKQKEEVISDRGGNIPFEIICEPLLGTTKSITNMTVRRWITGETSAIRERSSLIRICLALELDILQADTLLNKCGFNGFNIRCADDAVILYCLLRQRHLSAALKIYDDYIKNACNTKAFNRSALSEVSDPASGTNTTNRMENDLLSCSDWKSDDSFLKTFLIPNTENFTSFSKLALQEYYKIKNPFFLTALREFLKDEESNGETKVSKKFIRVLEDASDSSIIEEKEFSEFVGSSIFPVKYADPSGMIREKTPVHICDMIGIFLKDHRNDHDVQKTVSDRIGSVLSGDKVFSQITPSVINENGSRRSLKIKDDNMKILKDTLFSDFPHRQTLTDYERDPASGKMWAIRKAMILMYFYAFAYEYSNEESRATYFDRFFTENDMETFIETVNAAMLRCRLAPLYPADRFDWLILRAVREFEVNQRDDLEEIRSFLNNVIEATLK